MNRKGQALVEFVLILPVFLLILFCIVDFGNVLNSKNKLENDSSDMVRLMVNGEDIDSFKDSYNVNVIVNNYNNKYKRIVFSREVKIITPFLDRFLGNPCIVKVERVVPDA